jgi:hypothetical protein
MRLPCDPRRPFHEFSSLLIARVNNCLDGAQAFLEELILFNQSPTLSLNFIFDKLLVTLKSLKVLLASVHLTSRAAIRRGAAETRVQGLPELNDFHRVLIADAGNFTHVLVLEKSMHFTEEIVKKHCS